jgi:hypothetical protein
MEKYFWEGACGKALGRVKVQTCTVAPAISTGGKARNSPIQSPPSKEPQGFPGVYLGWSDGF